MVHIFCNFEIVLTGNIGNTRSRIFVISRCNGVMKHKFKLRYCNIIVC